MLRPNRYRRMVDQLAEAQTIAAQALVQSRDALRRVEGEIDARTLTLGALKEAQQQLLEVEHARLAAARSLHELQNKLGQAQSDRAHAERSAMAHHDRAQALDERCDQLEQQLLGARANLEGMHSQLVQEQATVDGLRADIDLLVQTHAEKDRALRQAHDALQAMSGQQALAAADMMRQVVVDPGAARPMPSVGRVGSLSGGDGSDDGRMPLPTREPLTREPLPEPFEQLCGSAAHHPGQPCNFVDGRCRTHLTTIEAAS